MTKLKDDINKRETNNLFRLMLRTGTQFYGMLEVQLEIETDKFNAYLKLPGEGPYVTENTWSKVDMASTDSVSLQDISGNDTSKPLVLNPYISWHGNSGEIHVNGFEDDATFENNKTKVIKKSASHSVLNDPQGTYKLITVILPLNSESYPELAAPGKNFGGSYSEVSDSPYLPEKHLEHEKKFLVIDKDKLKGNFLLLDIVLHVKSNLQIKDLPFVPGTKLIFVTDQIEYANITETPWRISIFPYQTPDMAPLPDEPAPVRFIGYSKDSKDTIVLGAEIKK